MTEYLLIASRDPFSCNDVPHFYDLARDLAGAGNQVTLFLVQNGVLPARSESHATTLMDMAQQGVTVFADEFSLRERAMYATDLMAGVSSASLDVIVDKIADGCKTLWH